MRRTRIGISIALLVIFAALIANNADSKPVAASVAYPDTGRVVLTDSWYGTRFDFNYRTCSAVADITITGVWDITPRDDGALSVAVGLTNPGNSIIINIDGLYRQCP